MAGSRRSPPPDGAPSNAVRDAVAGILARNVPAATAVAVAFSGGRDSMALLDACAAAMPRRTVVAFHVHHGLSPLADAWASFCRDACVRRGIALARRDVDVRRAGDGIEAAARTARYDALAALAHEHRVAAVLLAHHADDQAETVLLQLLRGAGPRGLAAMRAVATDRDVQWLRPFLSLPRATIDAYVAAHGLAYVDDDSNARTDLRRNALRVNVIPELRSIAPGYPQTLVRAAAHQADAAALLDELAALDATGALHGAALDLSRIHALPAPRARNVLRWFLRRRGLRAPTSARLDEMLRQLVRSRADARVAIGHDGALLGVHRGRIAVHRPQPAPYCESWRGEPDMALPHGVLHFTPSPGGGIALRALAASPVTIRPGVPGERLRVVAGAGRRRVADLLREAGIAAWERAPLPRLYCGDALAAVAHAGIDAAFAAGPGEPGVMLEWQPSLTDRDLDPYAPERAIPDP
jgi:tRNA(Ile)-lysidine synthase